jgi:hypothetical protein
MIIRIALEEIDEAFNWLVLILGTISATLVDYRHLYPFSSLITPKVEIQLMSLLFIPLIELVILWLSSYLIQKKEIRIVLKTFSWIYALFILILDLMFFLGIVVGKDIRTSPFIAGPAFFIPSLIYLAIIHSRYRAIYPDSKFLNSNVKQILLCLVVTAFGVFQAVFSAPIPP